MTRGVYVEPLGCYLLVKHSGEKVTRICFSKEKPEEPSDLAGEVADYLMGHGSRPRAELDLSRLTDFQKMISEVVRNIPRGETMTYGEVAAMAGLPGAARAVGQVMARNPFAIIVPCHRVVAKQGLGGFAWGRELKQRLLDLERWQP